jgi:ElaB/YqjD/DUF883 family membrane-anchored ribosome-binding protein
MPSAVRRTTGGIANRGQDAGHAAEAEQHRRRDQVDEGGHRLHEVQHRADQRVDALAARTDDAQRHADDQADEGGREHQGQRDHGLVPEAGDADDHQADEDEQAEAPVQAPDPERDHADDDQPRGHGQEQRLDLAGEVLDQTADGIEDGAPVLQQQTHALVDQVAQRQHPLGVAQQLLEPISRHDGYSRS